MRDMRCLLVLGCLVVIGCGKPAGVATTGTAPHTETVSHRIKGWTETKCAGVAFSLPDDVPVIDLSSGDTSKISQLAKEQFPDSPEVAGMIARATGNGQLKLMAIQKASDDPTFRNNVNLLELPLPPGMDEASLLAANQKQFGALSGSKMIKAQVIQIPAGKVAFIQAEVKAATGNYSIASYSLIHKDQQYVFTFSSSLKAADKWRDMAALSMKTMRFLD